MTVIRPVYIPKLFYGSDTKLREKEYYILINLRRRKHTYLHFSVRPKEETKLESNYETKERRKRILNGLGD